MKFAILTLLIGSLTFAPALAAQEKPASSLVSKSTKAIGYTVGKSTNVILMGTPAMPRASGKANVKAQAGITNIKMQATGLSQPGTVRTEIPTYVAWAVSPDGTTNNIGELIPDRNGKAQLNATTRLQTFSLLVTAEPYFAVRMPSELVVLENDTQKNTKAKIFMVNQYQLMRVAQYEKLGNPLALQLDLKTVPLEMYEARNALDIARSREAEQYAPEIFKKADASLKMAENALARRANKKEIASAARQAVQFSEDARALASERKEEERIAKEREAAAATARAEAEARAAAEAAEAKRRADAEAARAAELAAAREAQLKAEAEARAAKLRAEAEANAARMKAEAEANEARMKAEADAAAAKAEAEAAILKAKEEAAKAEADRAHRAAQELRAQLLEQFNRILETRETARGLVVNIGDVLFDTGKYNLRTEAREKLARFAGIVLGHPKLHLQVEGHTDNTGSDELNQRLSEQRAGEVQGYLVQQGVVPERITAKGLGKTMPIAENSTASGRQQNRRVEIVVSGDVIGIPLGR